ncbi:MAG: hypothetical protein U1F10_13020 [Burkholderiales bacterium]
MKGFVIRSVALVADMPMSPSAQPALPLRPIESIAPLAAGTAARGASHHGKAERQERLDQRVASGGQSAADGIVVAQATKHADRVGTNGVRRASVDICSSVTHVSEEDIGPFARVDVEPMLLPNG